MAHAILTGLHAPAQVSDMIVDVGENGGAIKSTNCKVTNGTNLTTTGGTFTRLDGAIPMPMQKDWLPMLPYINDMKDLNYYGLTMKGLKDGDYTVKIDGKEVGKYSAKQLAEGVNLGNATAGPIWEQGNKVLQAINAKNQLVHQRFRGVVMFNAPEWLADLAAERKPAELKKRMDKIDSAQAEIYKLATPVEHKFEVAPVK